MTRSAPFLVPRGATRIDAVPCRSSWPSCRGGRSSKFLACCPLTTPSMAPTALRYTIQTLHDAEFGWLVRMPLALNAVSHLLLAPWLQPPPRCWFFCCIGKRLSEIPWSRVDGRCGHRCGCRSVSMSVSVPCRWRLVEVLTRCRSVTESSSRTGGKYILHSVHF